MTREVVEILERRANPVDLAEDVREIVRQGVMQTLAYWSAALSVAWSSNCRGALLLGLKFLEQFPHILLLLLGFDGIGACVR